MFDLRWYECNVLKFCFCFYFLWGVEIVHGNGKRERETETLFLSKYDSSFLRTTDVWGCVWGFAIVTLSLFSFSSSFFILCYMFVVVVYVLEHSFYFFYHCISVYLLFVSCGSNSSCYWLVVKRSFFLFASFVPKK